MFFLSKLSDNPFISSSQWIHWIIYLFTLIVLQPSVKLTAIYTIMRFPFPRPKKISIFFIFSSFLFLFLFYFCSRCKSFPRTGLDLSMLLDCQLQFPQRREGFVSLFPFLFVIVYPFYIIFSICLFNCKWLLQSLREGELIIFLFITQNTSLCTVVT